VYHAALARPVPERTGVVAELCADDDALRHEVETLLAQAGASSFLAVPALAAAAFSAPASLIGRRVGPYAIESLLGVGGMGEVYRARDTKLGRDVAIKVLPGLLAADPDRLRRLEREARTLAALNHPHIGAIYGFEQSDGVNGLVLELVEGPTLADRLAESRSKGHGLPVQEALTIARQIGEALEAAHEKGIVHRDLKPANIKLTPEGTVKVLDFGLAKVVTDEPPDLEQSPTQSMGATREGTILGTAAYMSPEQARGKPVDKRTDIWAFGCVLYEMLTGRAPFAGETLTDTLAAIIEREPDWRALPDATPVGVRRLLRRCLEKDSKQRLRDIGDAPEDLTRNREPRKRVLVGLAVVLLCLAAALMAIRWRQGASPTRPVAVLVAEPRVAAASTEERTHLAAFALREAILRTLTRLEGIEVVDSQELPENPLSLQETVRAVAADEVVVPVLDCQGPSCRVSLRRQRGPDARLLGDSGPFDVSSEAEDSLDLSQAVALHLRKTFADHRPRGEVGPVEVKSADYERYLSFRRRQHGGEVLTGHDLDALEPLLQSSPGLTEARVLAASTARVLKDRPRADRILREAGARDRDDPRLASERFLLELETGTLADAQRALDQFEEHAPADVRLLRARATLLIRQGQLREAVEMRRRLLRERPSWANLWYIADVEIALADARGAREHLRQLLELSPRNPRGRAKLAELEWFLGDPATAARIYEELLEEHETRENVSNLGWSLLLAGEYPAAARAYRRALELRPENLLGRLNLGIAYEGMGDQGGAHRVYRDLLERIAPREEKAALTASERLLKAQALARLGQPVQAVELTMKALGEGERDSQVVFQAALIYALCGDQNHAIVLAREARERGLSPRWFSIPGFEPLRAMPAFQTLLAPG
jgi:tetratricopeptide (TPR) repeat protein